MHKSKEEIQETWQNVCSSNPLEGSTFPFEKIHWIDRDEHCYDDEWDLYFSFDGGDNFLRYEKGISAFGMTRDYFLNIDIMNTEDLDHLMDLIDQYKSVSTDGSDLHSDLYHYNRSVKFQEKEKRVDSLLRNGYSLVKVKGTTLTMSNGEKTEHIQLI